MPCHNWDDEADLDDREYPDEGESDGDDEDETVPCPYCRASIYEDAERCPRCGRYLSREDAPPARHLWWFVIGFLLCMLVMLGWIFP